MMRFFTALVTAGLAALLFSCAKDGGGGGSASIAGNVSVKLASAAARPTGTREACNPNFGAGPINGECFSPLKFTAKATIVAAGSSKGAVPARLINLASGPDGLGLEGPFGVLGLADFDFATPAAVNSIYSDDNIGGEDTASVVYDLITVYIGAAEMQIDMNGTNAATRYWNIRYPFFPKNPLDDTAFATCPSSEFTREVLEDNGDLYSAPNGFKPGDILLCEKANVTDTCAAGDWNFVNADDGSVTTTRPANTVQLVNAHWITDPSCSEEGEHPDMEFGGGQFVAQVGSPFKIIRTETMGENGPVSTYTHTANCNVNTGECTGATTSANKITATITFDLSNGVFAHNDVNWAGDSNEELRQGLTKILPLNFYRASIAAAPGEVAQNVQIPATVAIEATTEE